MYQKGQSPKTLCLREDKPHKTAFEGKEVPRTVLRGKATKAAGNHTDNRVWKGRDGRLGRLESTAGGADCRGLQTP